MDATNRIPNRRTGNSCMEYQKTMKAIITKYALTSGVAVLEGTHDPAYKSHMFELTGRWGGCFHGDDWHTDKQSALKKVREMASRKRESLRRSLLALDVKLAAAELAIEKANL